MKFALCRTSADWVKTIEIKSLKNLIEYMIKMKKPLIIDNNILKGDLGNNPANDCDYMIEVYDTYRE